MIQRTFVRDLPHGALWGRVRIPEGPPPRGAVILVPGFLETADTGLLRWLADAVAGAGFASVTLTSPGSGVSPSGRRTGLEALASSTHTRELDELGVVVEEVRAGDLLPRRPRGLALIGHGRGAVHALLHAATAGDIDALVTWAAPARLDRWATATRETWRSGGVVYVPEPGSGRQLALGPALMEDLEAHAQRLDPLAAARGMETPWLLVHGAGDLAVDPEEARGLAEVSQDGRLLMLPGVGHDLGWAQDEGAGFRVRAARDATLDHLRAHLASVSPGASR